VSFYPTPCGKLLMLLTRWTRMAAGRLVRNVDATMPGMPAVAMHESLGGASASPGGRT
jgi:hypothetical protein